MRVYEGNWKAEELNIAIVVSRFHTPISQQLLAGALDVCRKQGAEEDSLMTVWVPGAFEIPWALDALARQHRLDAMVALGVVVRGATSHYDLICHTVAQGVSQISKEQALPITLGVLTVENLEQAWERAGTKHGNKGAEAAQAAIEMATLQRELLQHSSRQKA